MAFARPSFVSDGSNAVDRPFDISSSATHVVPWRRRLLPLALAGDTRLGSRAAVGLVPDVPRRDAHGQTVAASFVRMAADAPLSVSYEPHPLLASDSDPDLHSALEAPSRAQQSPCRDLTSRPRNAP